MRYAAIGLVLAGIAGLNAAFAGETTVELSQVALRGPALVAVSSLSPSNQFAEEAAPVAPALPPELQVPDVTGALPEPPVEDGAVEAKAEMRDPFRPFTLDLLPKKVADDEFLTPLQRYELKQLTVVGLLLDLEPPRAMLQDDAGMGYIVTPGTLIGRQHGVVTDVQPGQVIVEETYVDFYGREQTRKAVMEMPEDEEVGAQAGRATAKKK